MTLFRHVPRVDANDRTQAIMRAQDRLSLEELVSLGVLRPEVPPMMSRPALIELLRVTIARGESLGYADDEFRDILADLEANVPDSVRFAMALIDAEVKRK